MAHGEAIRPLETTDNKPVDVHEEAGKSLATSDRQVAETMNEILLELKRIRLGLEILTEQELEHEI